MLDKCNKGPSGCNDQRSSCSKWKEQEVCHREFNKGKPNIWLAFVVY